MIRYTSGTDLKYRRVPGTLPSRLVSGMSDFLFILNVLGKSALDVNHLRKLDRSMSELVISRARNNAV